MRNSRYAGWLVVLVPACFHPSYDHPMCGPNGECPGGMTCGADLICGGDDGTPDAASPTCFGSFVKVCFTTLADVPKTPLDGAEIDAVLDTDHSSVCNQHNNRMNDYCVVAGAGLTLRTLKTIRGFGSKPLVLLSTTTLTLETTTIVDVSSNRTTGDVARGAGGNPASMCTNGTPAELAGGGYGGSFGGKGGDGERLPGAPATSGVAAAAVSPPPTQLRGGCPGGTGDIGGLGGTGGGAVALIAARSIQLDGKINASGAGGHGGPATQSGGGGGGSGGMIVLDAPSITTTGPLLANGGGGGQGGTGGGAPAMGVGDDGGESSAPLNPAAAGYNAAREGGTGGTGSAGTSRVTGGDAGGGGKNAVNNGGGGGGGGGAGFIHAHGVTTNISPPSFVP